VKHLALVVALVACGKSSEDKKPPIVASTSHDLETIYDGCWVAQRHRDMAALGNCYADNATTRAPGADLPAVTGRAKILEARALELEGTAELILAYDDNVAAIVRLSGTTNGNAIGLAGGVFVKFDKPHGVILEESDYFDSATIAGQARPDPTHPVRAWNATTTIATSKIVAAHDEKEHRNVTTVENMFGGFNRHDIAAFAAQIADNATWSEAPEVVDWTKAELIADHTTALAAFSDLAITASVAWGAGDYVVQSGEINGTNDGPMPGIATPTKKKISIPYLGVFHVVDGKVAQAWMFSQGSAFAKQLGL
jgi:ketosteroid isomerase-like protein